MTSQRRAPTEIRYLIGPSHVSQMERHVEAVNALGADAIVVVGDLVDDQVADIGLIVEPVSGLSAPDGQYFVLGEEVRRFWRHHSSCRRFGAQEELLFGMSGGTRVSVLVHAPRVVFLGSFGAFGHWNGPKRSVAT